MNIFHCCSQKTASQWIASIFKDSGILCNSVLATHDYYKTVMMGNELDVLRSQSQFKEPPPANTVLTPVYCSYEIFKKIPLDDDYRVFAIIRDPRDIVISWYFSTALTHGVKNNKSLQNIRQELRSRSFEDGLLFSIDKLSGLFQNLLSWREAEALDSKIKVFKFEDLTQSNCKIFFRQLFDHCQIPVPSDTLDKVLHDYSFENLTNRKKGEENLSSHLRKGVEGDWVNYFSETVTKKFSDAASNIPVLLGYKSTQECMLDVSPELIDANLKQQDQSLNQIKTQEKLHLAEEQLQQARVEVSQLQDKVKYFQAEYIPRQEHFKKIQELHRTQEILHHTQEMLHLAQETLYPTQESLNHTQEVLHRTQIQLDRRNRKCTASRQKVQTLKEKLRKSRHTSNNLKHSLSIRDSRLQASYSELDAIKMSKFWKLRTFWSRLRKTMSLSN